MRRIITIIALLALFATCAEAQMVGVNTNNDRAKKSESSSLNKPTGHYLRLEGGMIWGSIAYDYQINPYIMVGGGVGIGYSDEHGDEVFPIYAEAIFSTPRNKWSFYSEIKLGYDIVEHAFFPSLTIGANYKSFGLGIGCYMYKYSHYEYSYYEVVPLLIATYKLPLKVY